MTQSLELQPASADYHFHFGLVLEKVGNLQQAIGAYRMAITLNPRFTDAYNNLGNLLLKTGDLHQAETIYRQIIAIEVNHYAAHVNLGNLLCIQHSFDEAVTVYKKALQIKDHNPNALYGLISALKSADQIEELLQVVSDASLVLLKDIALKHTRYLVLPVLYTTQEEIGAYRNRFIQGLRQLIQETPLANPEDCHNALIGISQSTNFNLAYQGCNDLELQKQYGQWVHQILASNYPNWVKPRSASSLTQNQKIRIGYLSAYLRNHTVGKLAIGWLQKHCHDEFEIYCYHIGEEVDSLTQKFMLYSDVFHHISGDFEQVCQQIIDDRLHVLVFPDIGMDPKTTLIAGLRLAPVQCTTWGHPITSGLPTIDYYLSSELMEAENAQEHYSEQLVLLPNLGFSYSKPQIPQLVKSRSDYLQDYIYSDTILYLSCQSLFKYLPQFDFVFAAIAQQVSHARFLFLSHASAGINEKFKHRLSKAFAEYQLNSEDYCLVLPRQDPVGYLNLNLISDIYLDTFSWSGGNTTLEAIACGLPIVTCPGEFMRGRHSYGILKMLGVTDTIAPTEAEYIDIAVRLGLDPEWRSEIVQQMQARHNYLYDDITCVRALEDFYRQVVQSQPMSSEVTE
jgi:predicted O-linked N-acetylglucosamine transferase (SPINDLY family)